MNIIKDFSEFSNETNLNTLHDIYIDNINKLEYQNIINKNNVKIQYYQKLIFIFNKKEQSSTVVSLIKDYQQKINIAISENEFFQHELERLN